MSADPRPRLGFVVQRYGTQVGGGSELHCRLLAERLARRYPVEVLTTTATDYITWDNELPVGVEEVNGVTVRRFPVDRPRDLEGFARVSDEVFGRDHDDAAALRWVAENGPVSASLLEFVEGSGGRYDLLICYTFRYHTSFESLLRAPVPTILVPTAEDDPAIRLPVVRRVFESARGLLYLTPEEQALVESATGVEGRPSAIIGCGPTGPAEVAAPRPEDGRPYLLYVGRVDRNKGCEQLFDHFQRYLEDTWRDVDLLLVGTTALDVPDNPRIRHLGFVTDDEKYRALAGCRLLVMPSFFESLSIVVLEAWQLGRPVLVNAHCRVLQGQARRSNGGLWYGSYAEFREVLEFMLSNPAVSERLGAQGRRYVREHYAWEVIERKVDDVIAAVLEGGSVTPPARR